MGMWVDNGTKPEASFTLSWDAEKKKEKPIEFDKRTIYLRTSRTSSPKKHFQLQPDPSKMK